MIRAILFLILPFLLVFGSPASAQIIPIDGIQSYDPATFQADSPYLGLEVQVVGTVYVEAGMFGSNLYYIQDASGGIRLNTGGKSFVLGDSLYLEADVDTTSYGELELINANVFSSTTVDSLVPTPVPVEVLADDYEYIGRFLSVTGVATSLGNDDFYLIAGEYWFYITIDNGISISGVSEGSLCRVSGPCEKHGGQMAILPRVQGDLVIDPIIRVQPDGNGDVPTIQDAIDLAPEGTTIELAPGVYKGLGNRNLDWHAPDVIVQGDDGGNDPWSYVIDCQSATRGITFNYGEESATLRGVAIINGWASYGAGAYCQYVSPDLINCVFFDNYAEIAGGGLYVGVNAGPTVTGCDFLDNSVLTYRGGGAACDTTNSTVFTDCLFSGNTAPNGNGLSCMYGDVELQGCTFYENGLWAYGTGDLALQRCVVAENSGPSISLALWSGTTGLTCCDLFGNSGGNWVTSIAALLGVDGNIEADPQFIDAPSDDFRLLASSPCSPDNNGCGLMGARPVVSFTVDPDPGSGDYTTIAEAILDVPANVRLELADGTYSGTGNVNIDPAGKPLVIASASGDPTLCILDCGGLPLDPYRAFWFHSGEDNTTMVQGITIRNGYAAASLNGGRGGGVLCESGSSPRFSDLIFEDNSAEGGGGGLHVGSYCAPVVERCIFRYNESLPGAKNPGSQVGKAATSGGGGVHIEVQGKPIISDCTFIGNSSDPVAPPKPGNQTKAATSGGGGVHIEITGSATIDHCTFAKNSSPNNGGVIYCADLCTLTVTNTIIAFGTTGTASVVCDSAATITADISCSDFYGNDGGDWIGCIAGLAPPLDNNLSQDPFFCNIEADNVTLADNSPCTASASPYSCGQIGAWAEGGCGLAPYILRADGSGHFATIQDAIDAIPAGSVVLLEDGVYTG
ncbi:MAG: right-handed parallel beta-helix repeat-containing protein, partial [bacterium]